MKKLYLTVLVFLLILSLVLPSCNMQDTPPSGDNVTTESKDNGGSGTTSGDSSSEGGANPIST